MGGYTPRACDVGRQHDLALGDVPGQVRHRVGDVPARHRQHGHDRDRAGHPADAAAALVQGCEVAVQVSGVGAPPGDLATRRGHLANGLAVAGHVGHDHEHVAAADEGEVLGDGESDARGEDALDHRVVGGVDEQDELVAGGPLLQRVAHGVRIRMGQPHPREDDAERLAAGGCLGRGLRRQLQVGQPGHGEHRELLPPHEGGERVDRGDAREDGVGRRFAPHGVEGLARDRRLLHAQDGRAAVDGLAASVAGAAEPRLAHRDPQRSAVEGHSDVPRPQPLGALQHLHDGQVPVDREDQAMPVRPGVGTDACELVPAHARDAADDQQRPAHLRRAALLGPWPGPDLAS